MISLNFTEQWNNWAWPTDMMRERGLVRVFWVGTLVAFPSGCAVAISILSGNDASLVGVAISVSLLPPAVNAVTQPQKLSIHHNSSPDCHSSGSLMVLLILETTLLDWTISGVDSLAIQQERSSFNETSIYSQHNVRTRL